MAKEVVPTYSAPGRLTREAHEQRQQHWRGVIARWRESGLSMAEFCWREGIGDNRLSWWVHRLRAPERDDAAAKAAPKKKPSIAARARFVPVRVIEAPPAAASAAPLEVVTRGGHVIRLAPGFDPATLRRAVAALEGRPC